MEFRDLNETNNTKLLLNDKKEERHNEGIIAIVTVTLTGLSRIDLTSLSRTLHKLHCNSWTMHCN